MNSFVDLDYNNYKYYLVHYHSYSLSYLYEMYAEPIVLWVQFKANRVAVRFERDEKCFVIFISDSITKIVIDVLCIYSLKETLAVVQDKIYFYSRYDKLLGFS